MEKIKIGSKEVRLMPKQYRYKKDEVTCDEVMCENIICCDLCPFEFKDIIKTKNLDIIDSNEKLIEIEILPNVWYVTDRTLEEANEEGICCYDVYCELHDYRKIECEYECENCIFSEVEVLDLEDVNYRIW